ncbi:NAD dependent epimerase/dehydratase [Aspergillus luchuensis]|uniref:NAD dependent epimerase/dehydratase n=1 Tax=Aspergillus kawachii TaxID=1069201 RepID=A0A146F4N3_ASPKA|nr:NAD dependent epimerase/dehydratase [Aspergillus luchuensis]
MQHTTDTRNKALHAISLEQTFHGSNSGRAVSGSPASCDSSHTQQPLNALLMD